MYKVWRWHSGTTGRGKDVEDRNKSDWSLDEGEAEYGIRLRGLKVAHLWLCAKLRDLVLFLWFIGSSIPI